MGGYTLTSFRAVVSQSSKAKTVDADARALVLPSYKRKYASGISTLPIASGTLSTLFFHRHAACSQAFT